MHSPASRHTSDAFELVSTSGEYDLVITCEHASERMPAPWQWPAADRWLVGTHWAWDIGAEQLARELNAELGGTLVLSRFTRLLIDPNRPLDASTLFRAVAEGRQVELNRDLDEHERNRRIERLWTPYHEAVDAAVGACRAPLLLSIHTFTPIYEGSRRELEVGVLFDRAEEPSASLAAALSAHGIATELNEPWSGKDGLIYAVERHANAHGRMPLELEVRQDLAVEEVFRERLVAALTSWLRARLSA